MRRQSGFAGRRLIQTMKASGKKQLDTWNPIAVPPTFKAVESSHSEIQTADTSL